MKFEAFTMMRRVRGCDELTAPERLVMFALLLRADDSGRCFPSHRLLATDSALSRRTVVRAIQALAAKGWLTIEHRRDEAGDQTSSLYQVVTDVHEVVSASHQVVSHDHHPCDSLSPRVVSHDHQGGDRESHYLPTEVAHLNGPTELPKQTPGGGGVRGDEARTPSAALRPAEPTTDAENLAAYYLEAFERVCGAAPSRRVVSDARRAAVVLMAGATLDVNKRRVDRAAKRGQYMPRTLGKLAETPALFDVDAAPAKPNGAPLKQPSTGAEPWLKAASGGGAP